MCMTAACAYLVKGQSPEVFRVAPSVSEFGEEGDLKWGGCMEGERIEGLPVSVGDLIRTKGTALNSQSVQLWVRCYLLKILPIYLLSYV